MGPHEHPQGGTTDGVPRRAASQPLGSELVPAEAFPQLWLFLMGGLFIAVVMFFPNGLAGLWQDYGHYITRYFKFSGKGSAAKPSVGSKLEEAS